jgi:hypothetical protein
VADEKLEEKVWNGRTSSCSGGFDKEAWMRKEVELRNVVSS